VEHAASGLSRLEIDDLDSPHWVGTPAGPTLTSAHAPDVWTVGVILVESRRAWQYATAERVTRRDQEGGVSVRFHGKTAFAPVLSATDIEAAQQRLENWRQFNAKARLPVATEPASDDRFPNPRLELLDSPRPRRPDDQHRRLLEALDMRQSQAQYVNLDTIRLALAHREDRLYLGEGTTPGYIYFANEGPGSGGSETFPRQNLAKDGASISWSTSSSRSGDLVHGVLTDEIIAVRVNGLHAVMGANVFLIELPEGDTLNRVTLATEAGEHEIEYGPPR
jgi:hypothetical protein